jgi:PAS domain S-box-containing protein
MSSFSKVNSEDALRKIEESNIKFINSLTEGFELLELIYDEQGNVEDFLFLEVNATYEKQTGLRAAHLIGKRKKEVAPAADQRWYDYAIQAVKRGKTLGYEYFNPQVNAYYETQFIPLSPNQIVVLFKDITEHKKTQEALRQSDQKYRELYESFGEAFIATDWELNVIHWNKAAERVTTVSTEQALGRKVYEVLPEMLSVDFTPHFLALKEMKPARFMMNTVSRETKRQSVFEISTYPSAIGIIIIVEDKTEEEETKRLSAIGATAGMVGHDIRNPLQAILSETYLLKEELTAMPNCSTKTDVSESLEDIEKNVAYINKIVQDLQDYSRPLTPEYAEINVSDVFVNIFETVSLPESITLSIRINDLEHLRTDHMLLQRALANLVTNAIQAMPDGGKLEIVGQRHDDWAIITVADTGVGIPEEIKPKLFTPMITSKAKGQGFGLAVSKRLIETLRGVISFESQRGKGTKFTIELPL